jgi:glycine/D-amino acid oxidase-like deaminating enzyme
VTAIHDVIVLGVGGMGAAACYHLAQRGANVLGLEQYSLNHDRGSSHGESRIIRQAYFEHPDYVPLLFRSYELWHNLERATGLTLWHRTGLILSGPPGGETISGARLSATRHQLRLDALSPDAAHSQWPVFQFPRNHEIAFEPGAGTMLVESCVQAHVSEARRLGADLRANEAVHDWTSDGQAVVVHGP